MQCLDKFRSSLHPLGHQGWKEVLRLLCLVVVLLHYSLYEREYIPFASLSCHETYPI